jgi:lipocalin
MAGLLLAIAAAASTSALACPPKGFETVENFDISAFISAKWYIQQEMVTKYLPVSQNYCIAADYALKGKNVFGWDIQVHNLALEKDGTRHDSGTFLCAKVVNEARGQLKVGPCFLPPFLPGATGAYWVLAFDNAKGYALISGGPPTVEGEGGCRTGSGVNGAGLWIFTRARKRNDAILAEVRAIAAEKGFDLSVLNDVDQTNCTDASSEARIEALVV